MIAVGLARQSMLRHMDIIEGISKVHIYDTASGRRIQSTLVQGCCMQMAWSKSLDKLAICCDLDSSLLEEEEEEGGGQVANAICIMDPALQTEALLPARLANEFGSGWEQCAWTPCGRLLIAQFNITSEEQTAQITSDRPSGVWIVDPCTLSPIFSVFESLWQISWGRLGPSNRREEVIAAYFPELASHVTFTHVHGTWQADETKCDADKAGTGYLTPNGRSLLYFEHLAKDSGSLGQHQFGSGQTFVVASKLNPGASTVRAMLEPYFNRAVAASTASFGDLENAWIPLPPSWSGLFAFIVCIVQLHRVPLSCWWMLTSTSFWAAGLLLICKSNWHAKHRAGDWEETAPLMRSRPSNGQGMADMLLSCAKALC